MKKKNNNAHPSLCWDCRNSTKPWKCPWVRDFTPVKGWTALKTYNDPKFGVTSYNVYACPLFSRDAHGGGQVKDMFGAKEKIYIDDDGLKRLATAIIQQYVEDWKFLEYGALDGVMFRGSRIWRYNIIRFFGSAWFQDLLDATGLEVSTDQVCKALQITDEMILEVFA